jgi:streptogramin lyase
VTEDGKIGQFVLDGRSANPNLNQFATPSGTETAAITKGPNGNLFFTETAADKIGEITPAGVVTEFAVPTPNAQPTAITTGADGNVYFTEAGFSNNGFGTLHIGRIAPAGKITEFSLGGSVFAVGGITAGPDGNVYFTVGDNNGEQLGRITPAGTVSFLALPRGVDPGAVTTGPDGNLWVTDPDDSQVFRVTTADAATAFAVPKANGNLFGGAITTGPDGNLWFTGSSFIGRITTKGVVTEFPLPTKDGRPAAITAGPDGNLYFAESNSGAGIGRITTSGVITEIPVPASGGITAGPDGNIWVTEDGKIGRFVLTKPPGTLPPVPATSTTSASPAVSLATSQALAATDAAIEALASSSGQTSGDISGVVDPGTPIGRHRNA